MNLSFAAPLAFGAGLALLMAVALALPARSRLRSEANRCLAGLLLCFAAVIAEALLLQFGGAARWPHAMALTTTLPLLFGPLLWLYLSRLLEPAQGRRHPLWHGLPWLLALLAWLPYYLQPAAAKLAQWQAAQGIAAGVLAFAVLKLLHFAVYALAAARLVHAHRAAAPQELPLRHLWRLLQGLGLGALGVGLQFGLEAARGRDLAWNADLSAATVLSLFVMGLATLALREPLTHARLAAAESPSASLAEATALPPPAPKYGERALGPAQRSDYLARLQRCMDEEQAWRDGELLLDDLAARLAMTAKELSQLVNDSQGAQFQDYLNRFRVAELQRLLRDPARRGDSILALGLEAGFNSKSAITRAFKRHVGGTPSAFRAVQEGAEPVLEREAPD